MATKFTMNQQNRRPNTRQNEVHGQRPSQLQQAVMRTFDIKNDGLDHINFGTRGVKTDIGAKVGGGFIVKGGFQVPAFSTNAMTVNSMVMALKSPQPFESAVAIYSDLNAAQAAEELKKDKYHYEKNKYVPELRLLTAYLIWWRFYGDEETQKELMDTAPLTLVSYIYKVDPVTKFGRVHPIDTSDMYTTALTKTREALIAGCRHENKEFNLPDFSSLASSSDVWDEFANDPHRFVYKTAFGKEPEYAEIENEEEDDGLDDDGLDDALKAELAKEAAIISSETITDGNARVEIPTNLGIVDLRDTTQEAQTPVEVTEQAFEVDLERSTEI